ncbi:sigma factor [Kitasatospora sp. NPDC004669]|uniref:sigma factor n=1 Tax=Kitasatospora sp. NPDC004669 TaxID=3154555 RepID=UPI0033B39691
MAGPADAAADAVGYRPLLFSIAYGMTGSVGDAEDLVQDTFLNLTRVERAGTPITNLKAYLTTSVTRLGASLVPARINGRPGVVVYDAEGRVLNVVALDIVDGAVRRIHAVANPDKLGHLGEVSDLGLRKVREPRQR